MSTVLATHCAWCEPAPTAPGVSSGCCEECSHLLSVAADQDETDAQLLCRAIRLYGRAVSDAEIGPSRWTLDRRDRAYARVVTLVHRVANENAGRPR